jgi:hypothetical protein
MDGWMGRWMGGWVSTYFDRINKYVENVTFEYCYWGFMWPRNDESRRTPWHRTVAAVTTVKMKVAFRLGEVKVAWKMCL